MTAQVQKDRGISRTEGRKASYATAAIFIGLLASASTAHARLSTGNFTCSDVKDLIFQQGAIVLNTKSSSVYKRFVADRSFCRSYEVLQRISVPSKSEKCRLRHCVPRANDGDN